MVGLSFYLRIAQKRNFILFDSYSKVFSSTRSFFFQSKLKFKPYIVQAQ